VAKILVGCKKDLRKEDNGNHITWAEGSKMADDYKFLSYVECSALLFSNCDTVFSEAVRVAILLETTKREQISSSGEGPKQCFVKGQHVTRLDKKTGKASKILIENVKIEDSLLTWD